MSDKKYPAIYRDLDGDNMLHINKAEGYCLEHGSWGEMATGDILKHENEPNITREYLANTYGEVKNKEHAGFIVKLCKNAGIDVFPMLFDANHFVIKERLSFHNCGSISSSELKQITIPEPPEDWNMSHYDEQAEEFEMKQREMVMKENGENLHFGGEDECKEWPCVGDEVVYHSGTGVILVSEPDVNGVVLVKDESGEYKRVALNAVQKPKTPEEELRDEIVEDVILRSSVLDGSRIGVKTRKQARDIADVLLEKYNITKKPQ